jgi:hypothetical protein
MWLLHGLVIKPLLRLLCSRCSRMLLQQQVRLAGRAVVSTPASCCTHAVHLGMCCHGQDVALLLRSSRKQQARKDCLMRRPRHQACCWHCCFALEPTWHVHLQRGRSEHTIHP